MHFSIVHVTYTYMYIFHPHESSYRATHNTISYNERRTTKVHMSTIRNSYRYQTHPGTAERCQFKNWPGCRLTLEGSLGLITGPNCIRIRYTYMYTYINTYIHIMVKTIRVKVLSFSEIGGERGPTFLPTYLQRKTPLQQIHLQNNQKNRQYISEC